jgi:phosphoserine phosphatase
MKTSFLVVVDADSTLFENEVIELLAAAAGRGPEVAEITNKAMTGRTDFAHSLRQRVALLAGLPTTALDEVAAQITVTAGASTLISGVHQCGGRVGVISGGFHETLDRLADTLRLDYSCANRLGVSHGRLNGTLEGPIVDADTKASTLRAWAHLCSVPMTQTIAVGDGANDLEMLKEAGLGIAFNAKQVVKNRADIVLGERNLSHILPLLGLPLYPPEKEEPDPHTAVR